MGLGRWAPNFTIESSNQPTKPHRPKENPSTHAKLANIEQATTAGDLRKWTPKNANHAQTQTCRVPNSSLAQTEPSVASSAPPTRNARRHARCAGGGTELHLLHLRLHRGDDRRQGPGRSRRDEAVVGHAEMEGQGGKEKHPMESIIWKG